MSLYLQLKLDIAEYQFQLRKIRLQQKFVEGRFPVVLLHADPKSFDHDCYKLYDMPIESFQIIISMIKTRLEKCKKVLELLAQQIKT